jgi:hypothetical protein
MTAIISRVAIIGGHDGRAEIEVELTYDNGGTTTIASMKKRAWPRSIGPESIHSLG